MECSSCSEQIPDDSIFCPECGSRQNLSRGEFGFASALGGGAATGGGNTGVVSGEAVRQQREAAGQPTAMPTDIMSQIAQGMASGPAPTTSAQTPQVSDMPKVGGVSLSSIAEQSQNIPTQVDNSANLPAQPNSSVSHTDDIVNRIAEAEKAVKGERRSAWLQMNHDSAASVLQSISGELPAHLRNEPANPAADLLKNTMGGEDADTGPAPSLLRRMAEVAVRRVARKRGVAVETPQVKSEGDQLAVNVTFIDDGRVLDTPSDLAGAFQHAISTELALKGISMTTSVSLFCSKDGEMELVFGSGNAGGDEEDMFACEMCGGLVADSDPRCSHCGAEFEEEDDSPPSRGPPGRSGGPPGRGGGPPGRSGGPPGRGGGGPPGKSGGPPGGPSRSGGPPGKSGGPPGGPSRSGGPPGRGGGGPPGKSGGPPGGPSRSGGPPKGGPKGGPKGPKRRGPP